MQLLKLEELQPLIIEWAREKNLLFKENAPKQRLKLIEECGELASAILKNDVKLQKDAIGDIFVVLVILSEQIDYDINLNKKLRVIEGFAKDSSIEIIIESSFQDDCGNIYIDRSIDFLEFTSKLLNLDLTECANIAWNEIKDRKGKTVNGTFIKES